MPLISIIVPIYKVEKYLSNCIDSILDQTFTDFELILVNDGSPDNCGLLCDEYAKEDDRIRVIHKENGGLSSARNAGIDVARGEYFAFVDSDDFIHKKMYEILYNVAKREKSDIVLCDYILANEEESYNLTEYVFYDEVQNFSNMQVLMQLYSSNGVKFVVAWNKLYKKELFDGLRYEEGRIHEDEFIAHRILYKSSKVTFVPVNLYFYLQTHNSIIRSSFNVKKLDAIYAQKERITFFKQIGQFDLRYKAEMVYVKTFFKNYYRAKYDTSINNKNLRKLKRNFRSTIGTLLKNPFYNKKEKSVWLLFILSPYLFELYLKMRNNLNIIID
ncbi:glycosyltransferase family 2 protein [Metabacillus endolithicus]|uniref:Glycosyltransferase family 2 protein n=1 Tax=Metabacillus endolithicus TaxID=1535204 RepID=A0ABW5BWP1_9BACI|nr:glycosyltransferase [Metabacillus endolithicus]UPG64499.1 glycosyltransferase [Metabacillus endolithicus]